MPVVYSPVTMTMSPNILNPNTFVTDYITPYITTPYYPRTITMPIYENLNYNTNIQKRVINYFYYKTLEKWLYDDSDMTKLLKFFTISNDKIVLVKSLNDYEKAARESEDSESHKKLKVDFIAKYLLTKTKMGDFIYKFIKQSGIPWINLYRNQRQVKQFIRRKLYKKLVKSMDTSN